MTKLQTTLAAIMMTALIFLGLDGDGYVHKLAFFWAGVLFAMLWLSAWMEWCGHD